MDFLVNFFCEYHLKCINSIKMIKNLIYVKKKKDITHSYFPMAHVSYLDVCILFKGLDHPKTDKLSFSIFFSTLTLQCGAWPVLRDLAVTFPRP